MNIGDFMIYLDYSATTPTDKQVLDTFNKVSLEFIGNPNSLHKLGVKSNELIEASTKQILNVLNAHDFDLIYTSGSSEANNLALKGIADKYNKLGKHIITTQFEHSSIFGPLNYLQKQGFEVDFVNITKDGLVDLEHLKSIIKDTTILVSIGAVNSELGIKQPIKDIGNILQKYPHCHFHVDATQCIGKDHFDLNNVDLVSFAAHKFYGIKGIGALLKKKDIMLEPIIHGGKSTTNYRSGTPAVALIASLAKALRLAMENLDDHYDQVKELNNYLREKLSVLPYVVINSNEYSIPHIFNFSVPHIKPETMIHSLEEKEIYISTQSACASSYALSKAVYALTNNEEIASTSLRVSLSYLTAKEDIDTFVNTFIESYNRLNLK